MRCRWERHRFVTIAAAAAATCSQSCCCAEAAHTAGVKVDDVALGVLCQTRREGAFVQQAHGPIVSKALTLCVVGTAKRTSGVSGEGCVTAREVAVGCIGEACGTAYVCITAMEVLIAKDAG